MENFNPDFNQLLLKCIEGNASAGEMKEVWDWIKESNENRLYYENMRDIWLSVSGPIDENELEIRWQKFRSLHGVKNVNDVSDNTEPKRVVWRLLKVAAILILVFVVGLLWGRFTGHDAPGNEKDFYTIEAPRGAKSFVTLADGSRIWLNAGSRISYQRNYNQDNRKIFLEGEAFFEVAKNPKIPFYVHSSGIIVKAIGTSFNVKAYPEEGIVETTLVEGSISIESTGKSGRKEQILMQPHQKANFYKSTREVVVDIPSEKEKVREIAPVPVKVSKIERVEVKKEIDTELYTSWKDKRWFFEKESLEDFAVILQRIYDIRIVFRDNELKNYRLSGSLEEENLEQVLKALQYTVPMDYNIDHDIVTLKINPKLKNRYEKLLK